MANSKIVKALKDGYYDNKFISEGHVFVLHEVKGKKLDEKGKLVDHVFSADDQFSANWMEEVKGKEMKEALSDTLNQRPETRAETRMQDDPGKRAGIPEDQDEAKIVGNVEHKKMAPKKSASKGKEVADEEEDSEEDEAPKKRKSPKAGDKLEDI